MNGGDLLQMKAKNNNKLDKYLSVTTEELMDSNVKNKVSFFQNTFDNYKRPTNFAMTTKRISSTSYNDFGQLIEFTIPRYGDKINSIDLEVQLPILSNVGYVNSIGYAMIDYIEIVVGEISVIKVPGEWLDVNDKIYTNENMRIAVNEMIMRFGNFDEESYRGGSLIIPFTFWFTKEPGLAFPLCALSHQDFKVFIKLRPFKDLWFSNSDQTPSQQYRLENIFLLVNYIRLDPLEREIVNKIKHKYLIKQIQYITQTINRTAKISLDDFKYPVIELNWIVRSTSRRKQKDWFNYKMDNENTIDNDPLVNAKLIFEGKDRTDSMIARYYRMYQPLRFRNQIPDDYIYTYVFSLMPEKDSQPSGTCNFSEIKEKFLQLELKSSVLDYELFVFATNYNVLRVEDGYSYVENYLAD